MACFVRQEVGMEKSEKCAFLQQEVFKAVLIALTHRTGVYLPDVGETKRRQFQGELRIWLEALSVDYVQTIPENKHEANIEQLVEHFSRTSGAFFTEGRFSWGLAQKALNLYLKHAWCLGWIDMPPHCPIDHLVIAQVDADRRQRWMRIDNRGIYRSIVEALKAEAKGMPLALWELRLVNRANGRL